MMASGQLPPGAALPSVREVAVSLAVNPMTVSKAYSLLEAQGALIRQRGVGMLVAGRETGAGPQAKAARLNLLKPTLERAATEAAQLDIDADAAISLFVRILKGKK